MTGSKGSLEGFLEVVTERFRLKVLLKAGLGFRDTFWHLEFVQGLVCQ